MGNSYICSLIKHTPYAQHLHSVTFQSFVSPLSLEDGITVANSSLNLASSS
jgi:hypothetical protein